MFNSSSTNPVQAQRDRTTLLMLAVFFGAVVAVLIVSSIIGVQTGTWQYYGLAGDAVFLGLVVASAFQLTRRSHYRLAGAITIGGLGVAVIVLLLLFAGLGILLSLTVVFMGMFFSIQLLSGRDLIRGLVGSLGIGFIATLIDAYFKQYQVDASAIQNLYAVVVAVIVVSFIAFLFSQFRNYPIPAKLSVTYLLVALLPIAALVFYFTSTTRQALETEANASLQGASYEVARDVDSFLEDNLITLKIQALNPVFNEYLSLPPSERSTAEGGYLENEIAKVLDSYSRKDIINITSYGLLDLRGIDVVDTDSTEVGVKKNTRVYFTGPVESGLPYVSPTYFSLTTNVYSIYFSAPVRNENGKIIGVLRARYNANVLQELLGQSNGLVGSGSFPILVDENNIRLAHGTNPELILKSIVPLDAKTLDELKAESRLPDLPVDQISTNLPEFEAGVNNSDKQPVFQASIVAVKGEKAAVAVSSLTNQPWKVLYSRPVSLLYAPATTASTNASIASLVIAALVAMLALNITNQFNRPILRLTKAARQIAEGEANIQAQVDTNDEIGELAESFNAMTAQLTRRASELSTVAEVGTASSTTLEVNQLLQNVVDLAKERFTLYHAHIYLLDDKGENLVLASGAGEPGKIMVSEDVRSRLTANSHWWHAPLVNEKALL